MAGGSRLLTHLLDFPGLVSALRTAVVEYLLWPDILHNEELPWLLENTSTRSKQHPTGSNGTKKSQEECLVFEGEDEKSGKQPGNWRRRCNKNLSKTAIFILWYWNLVKKVIHAASENVYVLLLNPPRKSAIFAKIRQKKTARIFSTCSEIEILLR